MQAEVRSVAKLYDDQSAFYHLVLGETMHFGYWRGADDPASLATAQEQLTDWMIAQAQVGPGSLLLDAGFGMGRPAVRLAKEQHCKVVGITISQNQMEIARRLAAEHGVADLVTFQKANMLELPFAADTYDAAWAVECLVHVPDRRQALQEIFRVLKPGQRLVTSDLISAVPLTSAELAMLHRAFGHYNHILLDEYARLLEQVGFDIEQFDYMPEITRKTMILMGEAMEAKRPDLVARFGADLAAALIDGWHSLTRLLTEKGGYVLGVVRKPAQMAP